MIRDRHQIQIEALPETVFEFIDTMPNKFPVYRIMETKPFLFFRIFFVDGFRAAIEAVSVERPDSFLKLNVGDSMGPFQLTGLEKPVTYEFTLRSFFFNCRTGYSLTRSGDRTMLTFDLIAENPRLMEKVWWIIVKPIHGLLAKKVLSVIKERAETKP